MKKLFCTKNKSFYGNQEVELENIEPITEIPWEVQKKAKIKKHKEELKNGMERSDEECNR